MYTSSNSFYQNINQKNIYSTYEIQKKPVEDIQSLSNTDKYSPAQIVQYFISKYNSKFRVLDRKFTKQNTIPSKSKYLNLPRFKIDNNMSSTLRIELQNTIKKKVENPKKFILRQKNKVQKFNEKYWQRQLKNLDRLRIY